jgi:cardiolipin synthase A/B
MSRSIIVLPDDSAKPILDAVANAAKSVRIKMFIFSHPIVVRAYRNGHAVAASSLGASASSVQNPNSPPVRRKQHVEG